MLDSPTTVPGRKADDSVGIVGWTSRHLGNIRGMSRPDVVPPPDRGTGAARVLGVAYGATAVDALRAVVADVKRDDPLAPATVLVPNNIAGIVAQRALAAGVAPGRSGIAGLHITTLSRLAEQVAAPLMSPRTPATRAAVTAAWRSELDGADEGDGAGPFGAVRDHPATVRALVKKYTFGRQLGFLGEPGVNVLLLDIALDKLHPVP